MTAHARVRPSAFHMTVPCPASLQLQEQCPPRPPTDEEAEGHASHAFAQERASTHTRHAPGHTFEWDGKVWVADLDMVAGAALWERECRMSGRFEDTMNMPQIHATACFGTPDYWRFEDDVLEVKDYKYGFRFVDVFENYQLVAYTFGVAHRLSLGPETIVRMAIVQPRAFHTDGPVRGWATTLGALEKVLIKLRASTALALGENPPAKTGPHCLDCTARAACKTLASAALGIVDYAGTGELMNLSHEALGIELRILEDAMKRLEARKDGLAAQVDSLIRGGFAIPYYGLKPGRANLAWTATYDEVTGLADMLGVNVRKPPELITPTQAKAMGIDESIINEYATRPPAKLVLKADDTAQARKVFAAVDPAVNTN